MSCIDHSDECNIKCQFCELSLKIERLEKERDKGIDRIKKLEDDIKITSCEVAFVRNKLEEIGSIKVELAGIGVWGSTKEKTTNLTFGEAVEFLKQDKKVIRKPWPGFLYLTKDDFLAEDWRVIE